MKKSIKKSIIVNGLGFGDESKGSVVDHLTNLNKSNLVVRFNGGAQCAHNVYVGDRHFCFKQLSAGTFAGADTLLLDSVIVNPILLLREMRDFSNNFGFCPKVYIHRNSLITTPYHIHANRIEELVNNHGSCALGIWKTVEYAQKHRPMKIGDLIGGRPMSHLILPRLEYLRNNFRKELGPKNFPKGHDWECLFLNNKDEELALAEMYKNFHKFVDIVDDEDCKKLMNDSETVIFEGAQGALLDKDRGFLPHVSATDTTTQLAEDFLKRIEYDGKIVRLGLTRSYATRHGNGPLPSEVEGIQLVGEDNQFNEWQKGFRVGRLDYNLLEHALSYTNIDQLFVTCLDNDPFKEHDHYLNTAFNISQKLNIPLFGISFGKDRKDKTIF